VFDAEAAREAIKLSEYAKACRHNCLVLTSFLKDAAAVLDMHGRQQCYFLAHELCTLAATAGHGSKHQK
jgi:hypothetical protein